MKFIFIGNRPNVLKKMIEMNCNITDAYAVKDSYLEKYLQENDIAHKQITSKQELIRDIALSDFDCLVSNGCPYVLPVSKLKKANQKFINIHPSLLPDLKGKHPINGAIMFNRKHGVTCHYMDDGIDTGPIIESIELPITNDLNIGLIYQLSFLLEGEVFKRAFGLGFRERKCSNTLPDNAIYYTRRNEDLEITANDPLDMILRKIRAFGIPSLCARFIKGESEHRVLSARVIKNPTMNELFFSINDDEVLCVYDSNVLVKKFGEYIQFEMVDSTYFKPGERFFGF